MSLTYNKSNFLYDVVIVGGLGHVGLPLGLVFAHKGLDVCLYDIDKKRAKLVKQGRMPFIEYGAEPILKKTLKNKKLKIALDGKVVAKARYVVIAIGTPMDEYMNPKTRLFLGCILKLKKYLKDNQVIIVRSTLYPHTCQQVIKILGADKKWCIAYCPERTIQGYAIKELPQLPQIVAGLTSEAQQAAEKLFSIITHKIIKVSLEEAELTKLFSNAWRYIQFAVTNQFYMIAHNLAVDYNKLRKVIMDGYGRAAALPPAGFTAGPCLLKDTMQLAAYQGNNFILGHAAMMINEGLPNFIAESLRKKHDLIKVKVGILGMAFKADIDDTRDSLSYKLGKILRFYGTKVYYSDEYAKDPSFVTKEELISSCDIVIIAVPHSAYKNLKIPDNVEVVDLWAINKKLTRNNGRTC